MRKPENVLAILVLILLQTSPMPAQEARTR